MDLVLPSTPIVPDEPTPQSSAQVSVNPTTLQSLYDGVRVELLRARGAVGGNLVLGGLRVLSAAGLLTHDATHGVQATGGLAIANGVAQIRLPDDAPAIPAAFQASTLNHVDSCIRVERPGGLFGVGGTLAAPADGTEALVVLQYDAAADDLASFAYLDLGGLTDADLRTVVPLAYVKRTGGSMIVRDVRRPSFGRWRAIRVPARYTVGISQNNAAPTLLPGDLGGFVLRTGEGILLRASVAVEPRNLGGIPHQAVFFGPSRAQVANLTLAHAWPNDQTGLAPTGTAGAWAPFVGMSIRHLGNPAFAPTGLTTGSSVWTFAYEHLFVPRLDGSGPPELTIPGVYDFNGFAVWTFQSRVYTFSELTIAAQVVPVRASDVVQTAPQWWRAGNPTPLSPYWQLKG